MIPTTPNTTLNDQLFTKSEAAKLLAVDPKTVYNLVTRGMLPVVRITPDAPRFRLSDLRAFIEQQTHRAAA